jgi:titin
VSSFSNSSTITIIPAAPTGLTVAAAQPNALSLSWTDNSTGETGFVIERSANGVDFTQLATVGAGVTTYANTALSPAATWHYRVYAQNGGGNSAPTSGVHNTTLTDAPQNLEALSISATEIDLTWSATYGAASYSVERSDDAGAHWAAIQQVDGTSHSDVVEEGKAYSYRIRGIDAGGSSVASNVATATSRPAAPITLNASSPSATSVSLSWVDKSAGETGFAIERSTDSGAHFTPLADVGANITVYADSVSESSSYVYRVHAVNGGGVSANSNSSAVNTRPAAPTGVDASANAADSVTITWVDASAGETGFRVERSLATEILAFSSVGTVNAGITTLTDSNNLAAATGYVYRVVAINEAGESISTTDSVVTRTLAVTGFTATPASAEGINLNWTAPTGAGGFIITRSQNGSDFAPVATIDSGGVTNYSNTGLSEASIYTYRIVATNSGGASASTETSGTTLPGTPDEVVATPVDATHVTLTWSDNSLGEDGYSVELSTDDGESFEEIGIADVDAETFDANVEEGTSPVFRVRAVMGNLFSAYSETATTDTVPAAPSAPSITSVSASQLQVAWTSNSVHETGFRIERSVNGGLFVQVGTVGAGVTTFDDSGLDEAVTYTYQVRATMGSARNSEYSSTAAGTTRPSAPDTVTAGLLSGGIEVAWDDTSVNSTGFIVERSVNGGDFAAVIEQSDTTFFDSDVEPGTTYAYRVRATGFGGESANSDPAFATTIPATPSNVEAATLAQITAVSITWSDVAGETGYKIYRSLHGNTPVLLDTADQDSTEYVDETVLENVEYDYVVSAFNDSGESEQSSVVTVHTGLIAPTELDVSATPSAVTLTWADNSDGEAEYMIERSVDNGDFAPLDTVNADEETYTDSSVAEGTLYSYRISATNGSTASATSDARTIVTPLSAPTGVSAASISASEIDLSWTNAATGQTGFIISRSTDGVDYEQIDFVDESTTTYANTGLDEGKHYYYKIRAANDIALSDEVLAEAFTRPAAVTDLTITNITDTTVSLSWVNASTGATGFRLERSSDNGAHWTTADLADTTVLTWENTSLAEGSDYLFRVAATNDGGFSTFANTSATTDPAAPSDFEITGATTASASMTWTNNSTHATSILLQRRTTTTDWETINTLDDSDTSYTDGSADEATAYEYRVIAHLADDSDPSNADSVTTLPSPAAPVIVTDQGSSMLVSWTNTSQGATGFRVERSVESGGFAEVDTVDAETDEVLDTDIIEGTNYSYRVVVIGVGGETVGSGVDKTATPAAPTALVTSSASTSNIHLAWTDNSHQESAFAIERSTNGTDFDPLDSVDADENTYDDGSAVTGTQYYYRVTAIEGNLFSASTAGVAGVTLAAAPTITQSVAVSDAEVHLSWTAGAGSAGFKIERKLGVGAFGVIATITDGTTLSYVDTDTLVESSQYTYRIRGTNASGDGPASSDAVVHTLPTAATNLVAAGMSPTRVDLAWDNVSDAAVHVWRSIASGAFTDYATLAASTESFSDTGCSGGTAYSYKIVLNDGLNDSNPSNIETITTVPAAVTSLNAVANSDTEVALTWVDSFGATSYTVARSTDGVNFTDLDTVDTNSFTDTEASEATDYTYRVIATGAAGDGPAATDTVTTLPAAVTSVSVDSYTDTSVAISWSDPSDGETGFLVERSDDGDNWDELTTTADDVITYTDNTAEEATNYLYRVTPINDTGSGGSAQIDVTTRPTAASGVDATDLTATAVNIAWTDHSDGETSYKVLRSDNGGTSYSTIVDELDPDTHSYEDDTVLPASTYIYKVVAVGLGGDSADSNTDTILTVPAAVTNLSATVMSLTQVDLAWSDVGGNASYRLERKIGNGTWDLVDNTITANATTFSDTTATEGTAYTYRIFAVNATGASAVSNTPSAITVPATPTAMDASPTSATNIHVTWTDNSDGETGVELQRFDGTTWSKLVDLAPDTESYDNTVAAGSTYTYRVRMSNAGGNGAFSGTDSATTIPGQVTSVLATAADAATVNVTWSSVSGATGYRVMRSDNAGVSYAQVGTDLAANAVSYEDATADEATPYLYKVVAFNATGAGADSATSAVTTYSAAPTGLAVDAITTTQVQLSWTDNSGGEAHYIVYRAVGSGDFDAVDTVDPDTEAWNDSDIDPATTYHYYVTASNGAGESEPTDTVNALTRTAAPTISAATPTSATTMTVTWSAVTGATGGYKLQRDDGLGGAYGQIATPAAGAVSYNDTGLTEGRLYNYKLIAVNATGDSATSSPVSGTTFPAAPDTVVVGTVTTTTVDLSWDDNSSGETNFVIFRSDDNGDSWDIAGTNSANDTTFTDTGLTAGTAYLYHVTATDLGGSSPATLDAAALTLPAAPTGLAASPTSDTAIHISWTAQSGVFNSYSLLRDDGGGFAEIATPNANVTSYDDTGLDEGTEYSYKLVAVNDSGDSAASSTVAATTNPTAPNTLGVTGLATTGLTVTWTDNSAVEDGFEVDRSTNGTDWTDVDTAAEDATSQADSGLTEATHYYYRVRATMGSQASAWSSSFQVDTKPVAPASLTVTSFTDTSVSLEWADSSNGEQGYVVQRQTSGGGYSTIATLGAGITTYTDTGRTESSALDYRVHAYKGTSDSADSSTASLTTRPTAASNLQAEPTDPTTVELAWDDNSGTEDGFLIERNDGGGWTQIDTVADDVETYTDSAAPESATVSYRIRAYKGAVESANTAEVEVTTPVAVPTTVVPSATSHSTVTVSWTINSNVQTAQRLERSADAGGHWSPIADLDDNDVSYNDSGLTEDHGYQYRVIALVGDAESDPSSAGSVTTPLSIPTGLAATSPTATSVHLAWTNTSSAATNVVIERNANGGGWSTLTTIASSLSEYTDSTVSEGTPYQYRIHSTKGGNASATGNVASVTTIPAAPTSLGVSAFSSTQINLTWTDNSSHETGYEILRSEDNVTFSHVTTTASNATSYNDTGVHEAGTFYYLVEALGTGGASADATGSAITAPSAPTSFTVSQASATQLNLSWADNSSGETGYTVERSTDGGSNFSALTSLSAGATSYSDTTVSEASTYHYRVRADRSTAHSAWVTGNATTVPATPTGLAAAVQAGAPRVVVTWTDHSSGETGYEVDRSTDNSSWSTITTTAANAVSYSDTGVVEGTTYYYRVRAASSAGASLYSNTATASTLPSTPTGLSATAISGTQVNLSWTDVSATETGYKVERQPGSGGIWTVLQSLSANATSYSDTTALEGTAYNYRVRAFTTAAQGNPSATANVSTPLTPPSSMVATAVSTSQVNLTWVDNSAAESSYKIERSVNGGGFTLLTTVSANVTSYSDTAGSAGTTYQYRVRGAKGSLFSDYATSSSVTTAPTAPSGASASAASNTQVNVTWIDASGETAYTVERSSNAGSSWSVLTTNVAANTTTYSDTTATENSAYIYRVKATNAAGASAYSTASSVTTLPTGPSGLSAEAIASDTVHLTWTDNSAAETTFEIQRQITGSNNWAAIAIVGANTVSYVDPTLDESVSYEYRVRASVSGRNSAFSNTAEASTLPNAPDTLEVSGTTDTSVSLTWNNSTDAPTIVIERSDDGGENFVAVDTTGQGSTSYIDTGLTEGTTYVYRVRGYNGAGGFSDYTNTVFGVTIPAAPGSFVLDDSSGTQAELSWTDESAGEIGYVVERSVHGANDWAERVALDPGSTSFTDISVTSGDDWDYRIRVYNDGGANYSSIERATF